MRGWRWMSRVLEIAQKEAVRLEILELCRMAAPEGVGEKVVRASLKKEGYDMVEEEILRQADYLKEKGLLSAVRIKNPRLGINRTVMKITPAGTDYLEGNLTNVAGLDEG